MYISHWFFFSFSFLPAPLFPSLPDSQAPSLLSWAQTPIWWRGYDLYLVCAFLSPQCLWAILCWNPILCNPSEIHYLGSVSEILCQYSLAAFHNLSGTTITFSNVRFTSTMLFPIIRQNYVCKIQSSNHPVIAPWEMRTSAMLQQIQKVPYCHLRKDLSYTSVLSAQAVITCSCSVHNFFFKIYVILKARWQKNKTIEVCLPSCGLLLKGL